MGLEWDRYEEFMKDKDGNLDMKHESNRRITVEKLIFE
jgi:hypothetical protein